MVSIERKHRLTTHRTHWVNFPLPLDWANGAPLRLVIPVKYGIKNLKRIGSITYTDERPDNYWAERGYDYYAAL